MLQTTLNEAFQIEQRIAQQVKAYFALKANGQHTEAEAVMRGVRAMATRLDQLSAIVAGRDRQAD
jgi:hypothetical protein